MNSISPRRSTRSLLSRLTRRLGWLACSTMLLLTSNSPTHAGGGPENVAVIVNQRSWASKAIANEFCHLRQIPPDNVIYLDWSEFSDKIRIADFRTDFLTPILELLEQRHLLSQIDYLVYSSDFPYGVDYRGDFDTAPQYATGSLTGMSYLVGMTLSEEPNYLGGRTNWYMQPVGSNQLSGSSRGFRSRTPWQPDGSAGEEGSEGMHYFLSTMLGYTSGRGNSVSQVLASMRRSVQADGTHPEGTFYFVQNEDVRSTTRQRAFAPVAAELQRLGFRAEITEGVLPQQRSDVLGGVIGKATFDWPGSGSRMVPGAICDNLTSYGGVLRAGASQTPMTEFIRHGAAGTSGTVDEPYAIQAKFPHPSLHVHYAQGCSLAEAFYQSVESPYQLLITGDPLCQPFAKIPLIGLQGLIANQRVDADLELQPFTLPNSPAEVATFEFYLDGRHIASIAPGETYTLPREALHEGHHELRVVGVEPSAVASRGRIIIPFQTEHSGPSVTSRINTDHPQLYDTIRVTAEAPGCDSLALRHNGRVIAHVERTAALFDIQASDLGLGHHQLQAVGIHEEDPQSFLIGQPLDFVVHPPPILRAFVRPPPGLVPGIVLHKGPQDDVRIESTAAMNWLESAEVTSGSTVQLLGYVEVPADDLYQIQALLRGRVQLRVNDILAWDTEHETEQLGYHPLHLQAGWHKIHLVIRVEDARRCFLGFGGPGVEAIGLSKFRCVLPN